MKSILTDKMNIMPWMFAFVGLRDLWLSYDDWQNGLFWRAWLDAAFGILFLALAIVRIFDRRKAIREGRDPTVVRVRDRAP
jgi:hypothetical protein